MQLLKGDVSFHMAVTPTRLLILLTFTTIIIFTSFSKYDNLRQVTVTTLKT